MRKSLVFVPICWVDGNCKKISKRVSVTLVNANVAEVHQVLQGFVCVLLRRRVRRVLGRQRFDYYFIVLFGEFYDCAFF